jgi:uncharacterized membrane protein
MPRAADALSAATTGALFGLVVYGVYDLTNFATLAQYPLAVMFVDMAWGSVATAICAVAARMLVGQGRERRFQKDPPHIAIPT